MSAEPYRILMVCTGNICRSPMMERLLVAKLQARLPLADAGRFEISSAGTWGMVGSPIFDAAAATLEDLGGDAADFSARELAPELIRAADLVLGATREHRGLVVTAVPAAASRTVTLRELVRLLGPVTPADIDARVGGGDVVERMRAVVAAAFANRGLVAMGNPADDDIGDPYGRQQAAYVKAGGEIDAALDVLIGLLFPG